MKARKTIEEKPAFMSKDTRRLARERKLKRDKEDKNRKEMMWK